MIFFICIRCGCKIKARVGFCLACILKEPTPAPTPNERHRILNFKAWL